MLVVGLAEIGDKTQILSMILAAHLRRPLPIIFGILFATLADHAAAAVFGGLGIITLFRGTVVTRSRPVE